LAGTTLFPRSTGLALQREHVYYRHPAASAGLRSPARILWYVMSGPTNVSGLRAISTLREVVVGSPDRLYHRFAHLGVYSHSQVRDVSNGGRVMALRFSHTSMLRRPITLDEYRDAMQSQGRGLMLQGPQRLPERMFDRLATLLS
jgi:hypothetical protein